MSKKKSDGRIAFDLATICGIHVGDRNDYGYIVSLVFNLPRHHSRNALAAAIGTSVANGTKHVPAALFDGVCESEQEAIDLAFRVNVERDKAIFAARAKLGPAGIVGMQ